MHGAGLHRISGIRHGDDVRAEWVGTAGTVAGYVLERTGFRSVLGEHVSSASATGRTWRRCLLGRSNWHEVAYRYTKARPSRKPVIPAAIHVTGMTGFTLRMPSCRSCVSCWQIHIIHRGGMKDIPMESERLSSATMDGDIFNSAAAMLACFICASVITEERLFSAGIARRSPRSAAALYHI